MAEPHAAKQDPSPADKGGAGYELDVPQSERSVGGDEAKGGEGGEGGRGGDRPHPAPAPPPAMPGDAKRVDDEGGYELAQPEPPVPGESAADAMPGTDPAVEDDDAFETLIPPPDGGATVPEDMDRPVKTSQYQPSAEEPEVVSPEEASWRRDEQRIRAAEEAGREAVARRKRHVIIFATLLGTLLLLIAIFVFLRG